jgi:coatomer protein complex subunit gamma
MKDMNSKTDLYRANAIRVLCRITEGGLLGQIERYLKQAVVDKNPVVSSAALVSGIHLLQVSFDRYIKYTVANHCVPYVSYQL